MDQRRWIKIEHLVTIEDDQHCSVKCLYYWEYCRVFSVRIISGA